ncbi:MAG: sigma-54-dependent Fis family transcriptional regulator [Candidatus Marinimicrobia bacterium]|nr:sigma-54-dependent Fis family transcriptional regulator [Candidatus Neomarinimicrobiota bacterium]
MRILVVDDEKNIRFTLTDILQDEGYTVDSVDSGEKCLSRLKKQKYELVILDVRLPGMDGIQVFQKINELEIDTDVLVISGHSGIEIAVQAVKLGAYDFIEKPLSMSKILTAARNISQKQSFQFTANQNLSDKLKKYAMIGNSPQINHIRDIINKAAPTDTKVLIRGESGTGKELVAWAIHNQSNRRDKPFIAFNSAALPSELVESELFGYDKGAFTGAERRKIGKLELAHGGTLFLDEIGDMSIITQAKVLRVIQEGTFERVGGESTISIDVRVLAATHKDLEAMISGGTFRQDLFYRLSVLPIHIPALRERTGDVVFLAEHFLQYYSREMKSDVKVLTSKAKECLESYDFPGNVRELKNLMERLCILVSKKEISDKDCMPHLRGSTTGENTCEFMSLENFSDAKREFETQFLSDKLKKSQWNISATADKLGMRQPNLSRKIKELRISRTN